MRRLRVVPLPAHGGERASRLAALYGFDAISVTPTNTYGPGDNFHPDNRKCCRR
jgi:hypothetical protein